MSSLRCENFTKEEISFYEKHSPMVVFSDPKHLIDTMEDSVNYMCEIAERDGWGCS